MLVIVANRRDEAVTWLADRWHDSNVSVLTPLDLSVIGWRHYLPSCGKSTAVADGREISARRITGVLTWMQCVCEQDLDHIVPADRSYVASEMTAFLHAWLSGLNCPVLNRPTPSCLCGPNWRTEQWVLLAARLGVPVCPHRRSALHGSNADPYQQPDAEVTVVGSRCFGDVDSEVSANALMVARAAGVALLTVYFTGPNSGARFLGASLRPSLVSADVADAILSHLRGGPRC
jgi:hypothetical protein